MDRTNLMQQHSMDLDDMNDGNRNVSQPLMPTNAAYSPMASTSQHTQIQPQGVKILLHFFFVLKIEKYITFILQFFSVCLIFLNSS